MPLVFLDIQMGMSSYMPLRMLYFQQEAFRDIGSLFPDQDPQYKNKESSFFVEKALELIHEKGLRVYQADLAVILDKPKIAPYYGR